MDNTVPVDPEVKGIKEEFRIPLRDLKAFDTLNLLSTATKAMVGFNLMLDRNIIEWS
jgi:hypothetical protein